MGMANTKPRAIVVCMLYFLDETPGNGWCEGVLNQMGYNQAPAVVQGLIRKVYEVATTRVSLPDVTVVPLPLYSVLDGKDTGDYCQRVEPSIAGGRKMAQYIAAAIQKVVTAP